MNKKHLKLQIGNFFRKSKKFKIKNIIFRHSKTLDQSLDQTMNHNEKDKKDLNKVKDKTFKCRQCGVEVFEMIK